MRMQQRIEQAEVAKYSQTYRFLFNACSYVWLAVLYFSHATWDWQPVGVLVVSLSGGLYTVLMEVIYRLLVRLGDVASFHRFAVARIVCDSVFIAFGIFFTGKGFSPYYLLYLLLCIDGGLYFGRRGSLAVSLLCIAEYLAVIFTGSGYSLGQLASYLAIIAPFFFFVSQIAGGLAVAEREQRDRARRDPLTGLYNHGTFQEDLQRCFDEDPEGVKPLCVALFDIDHFKAVNDTHGHPFGDMVLRNIATVVPEVLRANDRVYRYGGEEFALILHCGYEDGLRVAERVRAKVAAVEHMRDGVSRRVTISAGVAERTPGKDKPTLVEEADTAAYASKERGRNLVTLWEAGIRNRGARAQ